MIHYLISVAGRLLDLHQPAELFLCQKQIPCKNFLISLFLIVVAYESKQLNVIQVQGHFLQKLTLISGLEILNKQHLTCRCIFHPRNFGF